LRRHFKPEVDMMARSLALPVLLASFLGAFAGASFADSTDFPPISESERTMTSVPGYPNAPAVVLFKKAVFSVLDPKTARYSPTFTVSVRRKILTAEGVQQFGEVVLHHSRRLRLKALVARTVLPDGRVLPLPKDATFRRRTSRSDKTFATSIAFPSVAVGAILDYRYEIQLGLGFYIEPWYFQEEVPTIYSEIVYEVPREVVVGSWIQDPMKTGIQQASTPTGMGGRVVAYGDNLPPIPDEPFSAPYADLASSFMLIPMIVKTSVGPKNMFNGWASTCELYAKDYERARHKTRDAERKGREIAQAVPGGSRRDKALALYRFVRDEIETEDSWGVGLPDGSAGDSVLAARRGSAAEKALLLQTLLAAAGIESRAVWVADRKDGLINLKFATPWWFDRVIVAVDLDGQRVFLDPSDRSLGFGHLDPGIEGMPALLFDPKSPEIVQIPVSPAEQNGRLAKVDWQLDEHGRLSGRGSLRLTGHHAWERIHWKENAGQTAEAWKEWLGKAYPGYGISDVRVDEQVDDERVEVSWTMAEREEEVLGDEASLTPSRPLGPARQPFPQPAKERRTSILFDYAGRDEVEMTLRWPDGWKPDTLPGDTLYKGAAGEAVTSLTVDEAGRSLTYRRRLDVARRELPHAAYPAAQALFAAMERHDAQALTLVRHP
jgi:transglutaminase-like putative cysteine protease